MSVNTSGVCVSGVLHSGSVHPGQSSQRGVWPSHASAQHHQHLPLHLRLRRRRSQHRSQDLWRWVAAHWGLLAGKAETDCVCASLRVDAVPGWKETLEPNCAPLMICQDSLNQGKLLHLICFYTKKVTLLDLFFLPSMFTLLCLTQDQDGCFPCFLFIFAASCYNNAVCMLHFYTTLLLLRTFSCIYSMVVPKVGGSFFFFCFKKIKYIYIYLNYFFALS